MKKKVLILVDWYEPGYKGGGPIQSCRNFVAAMHEDFDLYILTADRDLGDKQPYADVEANTWIKKNGVQVYYADEKKLSLGRLSAVINFVEPDFIYLNSMYSYHFTILPLWLKMNKRINPKIVIAPRGMLQQGAMQFKSFKKKIFIALINLSGVPRQLTFHATDEQEKKDVLFYLSKAARISVIPNFPRMKLPIWKPVEKQTGNLRCVFISRLVPKKNILFLLDILKELPSTIHMHLTIRGEVEDQLYWKKCTDAIEKLPAHISVSYGGPVSNDEVINVLNDHHLFVLPTRGENFGHAIFEAWSSGKPVLISDQTPWRNLSAQKIGWDIALDKPQLFLQAIEQAACFNQQVYDEWSRSAWGFAKNYIEQLNIKKDYIKLFS